MLISITKAEFVIYKGYIKSGKVMVSLICPILKTKFCFAKTLLCYPRSCISDDNFFRIICSQIQWMTKQIRQYSLEPLI